MTEHPTRTRDAQSTKTSRSSKRGATYELEADAIKALAHPKRLLIVDLLRDGKERTVSQLQDETSFGQSTLSQNLGLLRTAGLVNARREGNNVHYSIRDPRVLQAIALLRGVLEAQLQDKQFLLERDAAKAKERTRNATALGILVAVGLVGASLAFAATHPLFVGGSMEDVGSHVNLLLSSPSMETAFRMCADVMTEASSASMDPMTPAA